MSGKVSLPKWKLGGLISVGVLLLAVVIISLPRGGGDSSSSSASAAAGEGTRSVACACGSPRAEAPRQGCPVRQPSKACGAKRPANRPCEPTRKPVNAKGGAGRRKIFYPHLLCA